MEIKEFGVFLIPFAIQWLSACFLIEEIIDELKAVFATMRM